MGDGWCIGVIVVMVHVLGPESGGCLPLSSGEDRPLGRRTYSTRVVKTTAKAVLSGST